MGGVAYKEPPKPESRRDQKPPPPPPKKELPPEFQGLEQEVTSQQQQMAAPGLPPQNPTLAQMPSGKDLFQPVSGTNTQKLQ